MASINKRKSTFSVIYWYLDNAGERKQKQMCIRDRTQAGYAVHSAKQKAKDNVSDFKRGVVDEDVYKSQVFTSESYCEISNDIRCVNVSESGGTVPMKP